MNSEVKVQESIESFDAAACSLDSSRTGRVPGLLSLLAIPAAVSLDPLFYGLAGGLLGVISLLRSPARCRLLGLAGVLGSATVLVLSQL